MSETVTARGTRATISNPEMVKPLLCELHAHTTWSDGGLSLPDLVELYGRAGFDVLCVTDHTHPAGDEWAHLGVRPDRQPAYFQQVEE